MTKLKKILLALALVVAGGSVSYALTVEQKFLMNRAHSSAAKIQLGSLLDGKAVKGIARFVFDSQATEAGSDVANSVIGNHAMKAVEADLPADAVVTDVNYQILTQFVDAGSGTVAFNCTGVWDQDLEAATDITGSAVGVFLAGVPVGTAATYVDSGSAGCEISVRIGGAAPTAGKAIIWVEYTISE